jgi:hypothetical protein
MEVQLIKYIIPFYVSSHGFGHITRVLAIVLEILNHSNYDIYIVSGFKQIEFAQIYLKEFEHRLIYKITQTDVGLINRENSLAVDTKRLQNELSRFVSSWKTLVNSECEFLRTKDIEFIVTDISPIGPLVAEYLGCECYAISNFTWKDQYETLEISNDILERFAEAYDSITHYVKYALAFGDITNGCKVSNVGFVSRAINYEIVEEIKRKFNPEIFLTLGKSAAIYNMRIRNLTKSIIITEGVEVSASTNTIKLPLSTLDTHNYIAASEYVITKAGWSTVSESLIGGSKLILLDRPSVYEDTFIINQLVKEELAISIEERQLNNLDFNAIKNLADQKIDAKKLALIKNDTKSILRILNVVDKGVKE